jgi:hypothetical protein
MKKLGLIFLATFLASFGRTEEIHVNIEVESVKYINSKTSELTLVLKNRSSKDLNFLTWSCSNDRLFGVNNDAVIILETICDKNISVTNALPPNKSKIFKIKILKKAVNPKFKIEFTCTFIPDTKQISTMSVWSNEVQL